MDVSLGGGPGTGSSRPYTVYGPRRDVCDWGEFHPSPRTSVRIQRSPNLSYPVSCTGRSRNDPRDRRIEDSACDPTSVPRGDSLSTVSKR